MSATPVNAPFSTHAANAQITRGLWLGFVGVVIFAATLPMTKIAVGSLDAPQLSPWFISFGRAAAAGVLSALYLLVQRGRGELIVPQGRQWALLFMTACGVVVGFPLFLALALQYVPSTHGAVVTGLLPLATAVLAALWFRQRPSVGFWLAALAGTLLVLAFMGFRSANSAGQFSLHLADVFLLIAMVTGAFGYIGGAQLTPALGAERVICWVLVMSLPLTLPMTWFNLPANPERINLASWGAFAYVAVFSMWVGFFAWYRGLALGGAVRVSQVHWVQPFISLLFAVPLLGEKLDALTLGFGLAVVATVFIGKKMPVEVVK